MRRSVGIADRANPCAVFPVRKSIFENLCPYQYFRTTYKSQKTFEPSKTFQNQPETAFDTLFVYLGWGVRAKT